MSTRFVDGQWFCLTSTDCHQDPELSFASGDILVYLRHPGQSSRGPALRVHSHVLASRGFQTLLDQCVTAPNWHEPRQCLQVSCSGCDRHTATTELYIPAPETTTTDAIFDHYVTTRNFFAWLYDLPLTGRTLSSSLRNLLKRIHTYRERQDYAQTRQEIIAFAESQRYLDFRECIDHALAILNLAEEIHEQDLWIDAFAHVVGMSHQVMATSPEYAALSPETQASILASRLEMDVRLSQASSCIESFFGDDLSSNFLGLAQAAREHFDRFRSFLHGYYIELYGFWPPAGFDDETRRAAVYSVLYTDFRNLYLHLVDAESSPQMHDHVQSGGVCTLQNIEAFDRKHSFETLSNPLPRVPLEPDSSIKRSASHRRQSWNPVVQRRIDQKKKRDHGVQALFNASNRELSLMSCEIVRRYSQFEEDSVDNESEKVSSMDGRKVRWILIYAILQVLISVMATPKTVRNTEGLSYPLCCLIPQQMPWKQSGSEPPKAPRTIEITPDIDYRARSVSFSDSTSSSPQSSDRKMGRQTTPGRTPSTSRVNSLKRLLMRRQASRDESPVTRSPSSGGFSEILVHGYGNGLNNVEVSNQRDMTLPTPEQMRRRVSFLAEEEFSSEQCDASSDNETREVSSVASSVLGSVSRETSNASSNTTWSKSTQNDGDCPSTPTNDKSMTDLVGLMETTTMEMETPTVHGSRVDEIALTDSLNFDTKMWDTMLVSRPSQA